MNISLISQVIRYDPKNGLFYWLVDRKGHAKAGDIAGAKHNRGYIRIGVNGESYLAHRLALLLSGMTLMDRDQVDHINGDRSDNRLSNLRIATHSENCQNAKARKDNATGLKGVGYDRRRGMWRARIKFDRSAKWLGYFNSPEEAHAAYCAEAIKLHGPFHRT